MLCPLKQAWVSHFLCFPTAMYFGVCKFMIFLSSLWVPWGRIGPCSCMHHQHPGPHLTSGRPLVGKGKREREREWKQEERRKKRRQTESDKEGKTEKEGERKWWKPFLEVCSTYIQRSSWLGIVPAPALSMGRHFQQSFSSGARACPCLLFAEGVCSQTLGSAPLLWACEPICHHGPYVLYLD